jgi:hypothetical protein
MPLRHYAITPLRQYASTAITPVRQYGHYASTPVWPLRQYASTALTPLHHYGHYAITAIMPVRQYGHYTSMPVRPLRHSPHSLASVKDMYVETGFPLNLYRQLQIQQLCQNNPTTTSSNQFKKYINAAIIWTLTGL